MRTRRARPSRPATPRPAEAPPPPPPPGLRRQLGATRDALIGLVRAHIDLAKAEASEIGGEVGAVAIAVGIAIGGAHPRRVPRPDRHDAVPRGVAVRLDGLGRAPGHRGARRCSAPPPVLGSLGAGRVARAIALAFLAGLVVAILFGTNAPNLLYVAIAERFGPGIDPGVIALVAGTGIGLVVGGLLGLLAGARRGTGGDAVSGLIGGAVLGGDLRGADRRRGAARRERGLPADGRRAARDRWRGRARRARPGRPWRRRGERGRRGVPRGLRARRRGRAFSAITFAWHVAIAIGIALFLGLAIALMLADVASRGIDTEALKQRFYPQASIDMGKETIEWAKARMPRGPRS